MGQIIIEIPQDISRSYRIVSEEAANRLVKNLERFTARQKKEEDEDILSLWTKAEPFAKTNTAK